MNEKREHPDFEAMSDFLDGYVGGKEASAISEHLSNCDSCTATYKSLAGLVASASALPKSVLPQDDIWGDLRRSLNDRKGFVLPVRSGITSAGVGSTHTQRISGRMVAMLAIAAAVLIALSSGITALVLRRGTSNIAVVAPKPSSVQRTVYAPNAVLPTGFRQTEDEFNRTIQELQLAVDTQRGQLSPETIRTVERSLAVVDSAIAEARTALLADPNNQMLVDLLSASYQRKLDLLRRTSELGSRT